MPNEPITSFRDEYFFLSNFYACRVEFGGLRFLSSEAVFQAAKCANKAERVKFQTLGPGDAKRLGRRVALRADWEEKKIKLMYKVIKAKFDQNTNLQKKLEDTFPRDLIEGNTWGDCFWGMCEGQGHNWLGKLLMELRDEYTVPF